MKVLNMIPKMKKLQFVYGDKTHINKRELGSISKIRKLINYFTDLVIQSRK